jgi:hypothetical protein
MGLKHRNSGTEFMLDFVSEMRRLISKNDYICSWHLVVQNPCYRSATLLGKGSIINEVESVARRELWAQYHNLSKVLSTHPSAFPISIPNHNFDPPAKAEQASFESTLFLHLLVRQVLPV